MRSAMTLRRTSSENIVQRQLHVTGLARALDAISPLATLRRGFAILRDTDGSIVRGVAQSQPDQRLVATLADGDIALRVEPSQ